MCRFSLCLLSFLLILAANTGAAPEPERKIQKSSVPQKTLDGIYIEAVEAYPDTKANELNLGVGLYPFNAYYQGISLTGGYTYHFNNTFGWEILNAQYYFTFDKGLTTELAERFARAPEQIDRVKYIATTNAVFNLARGKFVLLRNYIRYFQSSAIAGVGVVKIRDKVKFAPDLGLRFSVILGDRFSWNAEVRDVIAVPGFTNVVTFSLLGGYSF